MIQSRGGWCTSYCVTASENISQFWQMFSLVARHSITLWLITTQRPTFSSWHLINQLTTTNCYYKLYTRSYKSKLKRLNNTDSFQRAILQIHWRFSSCLNMNQVNVCVLNLVQLFSDDLSLHFYNQSEINSEDNTKWGCLNKIQDTDFNCFTD